MQALFLSVAGNLCALTQFLFTVFYSWMLATYHINIVRANGFIDTYKHKILTVVPFGAIMRKSGQVLAKLITVVRLHLFHAGWFAI